MIAHLNGRAEALADLGWTGPDAEWLALVCLHSGVFLRSQYLAFTGESNRVVATRFIQRCGDIVVWDSWNGSASIRLYRIVGRPVYRALGAEHIRHRREASAALLLRRVLTFDYVLEHAGRCWLPTEDEKVRALTAADVPEAALPRRVYPGTGRGQTRYFVNKLPVALDATGSTFVFVQVAGEDALFALRSWGESHAALWAALRGAGRAVSVVLVGRDRDPLDAAEKVVQGWASAGPTGPEAAADAAELARVREAVGTTDAAVLDQYGGFDGAVRRLVELEDRGAARPAAADGPHATPRISSAAVWRSSRGMVL